VRVVPYINIYEKETGMTKLRCIILALMLTFIFAYAASAEDACVACHQKISPGQVKDWQVSKHSKEDVTCSTCHGEKHTTAEDAKLATMPDESVCGECHEQQFEQFSKGKHNHGWTSLNAMPVTHVEPDELMEGGRGCGGCHNMGIKSEAQKKEQRE
jgi:hydroxylamine dehydrogenase